MTKKGLNKKKKYLLFEKLLIKNKAKYLFYLTDV